MPSRLYESLKAVQSVLTARQILVICSVALSFLSCTSTPQDKVIAKIGNSALYASDAEFLAAIRPENGRGKKAIEGDLQQVADTRRAAETARRLYAGAQNKVASDMAEGENARLAQVYTYFYLRANLGNTDKVLLDYYKKNETKYSSSGDSAGANSTANFIELREKVAGDLFISKLPAEVKSRINDSSKVAFLDSVRRDLISSEADKLRTLYKIAEVKPENSAAEEYYKAHPEEFQTQKEYKLRVISSADSAELAKKISTGISADSATPIPTVKHGHAIMDIGMFPALFDTLGKAKEGIFTPILQAPDTKIFYVFFVDSIIPPTLKTWDRAKWIAKSIVESKGDFPLDSAAVLATENGKPIITEKEVLAFQAKVAPQRKAGFRRDAVVKTLIERHIYARAAREKGVDKSLEYIAWNRQLTDQAYAQVLIDSLLSTTLGVPEDSLKVAYETEKDSLFEKPYDDSKLDIAVWLRIPDISYRREFALNAQNYTTANTAEVSIDWKNYKRAMYKQIRYREFSALQEKELAELQKSVPVAIADTSWHLEFLSDDAQGLVSQAKLKYDSRDLQKAIQILARAQTLFPQNDSLQKSTSYELANIYQELGQYRAATDLYKIITQLWENDSDSYKAYFMWGFVLNEYEKKDSLALNIFEEMLKKFPNSDLSDDAKIMVDNIKSGGKVLEDLLKKIEADTSGAQY
ncbi:hypothetical protein AGMMS49938_03360 [Fibrobacterales bacterium]|nr:hypothetical protein AGMMS49938_03360 [Fibrobacterales bacterium]